MKRWERILVFSERRPNVCTIEIEEDEDIIIIYSSCRAFI